MVKQVTKKTVTETISEDGSKKTVIKEHAPKVVLASQHTPTTDGAKKAPAKKKMTAREREELLIENFVGLQHAMTNMSIKFGSLSDNISKLLQVFEEAAKNTLSGGKSDDKDMLKKIDALLTQNKTIAKGLVLMEGNLRGRAEEPPRAPPISELPPTRPKPLPRI